MSMKYFVLLSILEIDHCNALFFSAFSQKTGRCTLQSYTCGSRRRGATYYYTK